MSRTLLSLTLWVLPCAVPAAYADQAPASVDGVWSTVVSCRAAGGALPYSYEFLSSVKGGVLHGERGVAGAPGWLELDGRIQPDGSATLSARGIVGSARAAEGERPRGTPYRYQIEARFAGDSGSGQRTKGRDCTVTFARKTP
jgi:hypothetical protein